MSSRQPARSLEGLWLKPHGAPIFWVGSAAMQVIVPSRPAFEDSTGTAPREHF
jgi:hypothetical protein